jgi:hypothetical protein
MDFGYQGIGREYVYLQLLTHGCLCDSKVLRSRGWLIWYSGIEERTGDNGYFGRLGEYGVWAVM